MTSFAFQWHLTDNCDQRCRHCYIFSARPESLQTMPLADMERVLANCLDFGRTFLREPYFYLTGGDPLLHPDFWRLLEALHGRGLRTTVMGNPFHLDAAACRRMRALGVDKYQLSLDGLRETHNFFRKPDSFDALAAAGCRTYFYPKDHLWTLLDWEEGRFHIPDGVDPSTIVGGCNCGNCHLTILPDGAVMACRRVPGSVVGNALRDRLADLWLGPMERYRDYGRFGKCAGCELLRFCRGCPAVAASTALARARAEGRPAPDPGDAFYAPDPQCWRATDALSTEGTE